MLEFLTLLTNILLIKVKYLSLDYPLKLAFRV